MASSMPFMDQPSMYQPISLYPSAKASVTSPDDSNEVEEEAVLQGTLYVPVCSTIKGTYSFTVVEIEQSPVQGY